MKRISVRALFFSVVTTLCACSSDPSEEAVSVVSDPEITAPEVTFKSEEGGHVGTPGTPGAPYRVTYRIVGTPIVGSPVIVDLMVESLRGAQPVTLDYRISDASSMLLGESQPARILMEPAANDAAYRQQVTVIPQREGRFYLNVSASFETETGTQSTVTAVPIQVGTGSRELQPNGEVQTDENGEAVRVLSAE